MRPFLLLTMLFGIAQFLPAQTAPLACDGRVVTVRVSEIKPGGTAAGFLAALQAQQAWYAAKNTKDVIVLNRVMVRDPQTKAQSYSEKEYLTFHIRAKSSTLPQRDDAYAAFVKMFQDNSDIKSEYTVCMPSFGN